jgi:large subunit ribosomal protein L10
MARSDKVAAVAELTDRFSNSGGVVLTEYRGLSVKALMQLRRSLGDDASYAISKNTLTTIAAREAGLDAIEEQLVGPTAIAFMTPDDVRKLADLESREVLLAKVAGALQGVLQQAVSLVSAPLSQAARLFAALEQAAGENPSLMGAAPELTREPTNEELAAEAAQPAASAAAEAGTAPAADQLAAPAAEDQ